MTTHKICFFNRSSVHYRKNIWLLMDRELPCDFYFGDSRPGKIEPIPYELFEHFKGEFHNVNLGPFYWQKGALSLLKSDYTDIITTAEPLCLSSWVLVLFSRMFHKNVYSWTHGAYGNENAVKRFLIKWKIRHLKGCFLYGEYARDILVKWGVPQNKLHVVYNSLNYEEQLPMRKELVSSSFYQEHFNNSNRNIVFIGRLTTVKKLDQLLKAVAELRKRGEELNVTVVGDGTEKQKLMSLAKELELDNVWFYGACYDEKQIAQFLYNADLCVSPGNVGLSAIHAMSFGCPVISHNNYPMQMPEFEAVEDGKTGTFFKENDVDALADAICNWIRTCGDREAVRQACYKVVDDKYNPHVQIETLKTIIYSH